MGGGGGMGSRDVWGCQVVEKFLARPTGCASTNSLNLELAKKKRSGIVTLKMVHLISHLKGSWTTAARPI